jgi:hypothetical protein
MTSFLNHDALVSSLHASRTLQMLLYSGFFFGAGLLLFNHDRKKWALVWQFIGLAAVALNAIGALSSGLWPGATIAAIVLALELWLMKGCWHSELKGLQNSQK